MLKYPVKLVILNSPVAVLKLKGEMVEDTSFDSVESYSLYDYFEQ